MYIPYIALQAGIAADIDNTHFVWGEGANFRVLGSELFSRSLSTFHLLIFQCSIFLLERKIPNKQSSQDPLWLWDRPLFTVVYYHMLKYIRTRRTEGSESHAVILSLYSDHC